MLEAPRHSRQQTNVVVYSKEKVEMSKLQCKEMHTKAEEIQM